MFWITPPNPNPEENLKRSATDAVGNPSYQEPQQKHECDCGQKFSPGSLHYDWCKTNQK